MAGSVDPEPPMATGDCAEPVEITVGEVVLRSSDGEVVTLGPFEVRITLPFEQLWEALRPDAPRSAQRDSLVGTKEKARLLDVDVATVYRHAEDLGGRKVGGLWRFPREDRRPSAGRLPERLKTSPRPRRRTAAKGRTRTLKLRGERPSEGV
jgi:hypothetical protein